MTYYEWKIKVDGQTWARGTAPERGTALNELDVYLMQYQDDWENKIEITIKKKEIEK